MVIPNLREYLSQEINFSGVRKATLKKEHKLDQKEAFELKYLKRKNPRSFYLSPSTSPAHEQLSPDTNYACRGCLACFGTCLCFFFFLGNL